MIFTVKSFTSMRIVLLQKTEKALLNPKKVKHTFANNMSKGKLSAFKISCTMKHLKTQQAGKAESKLTLQNSR